MNFVEVIQEHLNILRTNYPSFMHLRLFIDSHDNELIETYLVACNNHNRKILNPNNNHIDAGFDIFVPYEQLCMTDQPNKVDHLIRCSAVMHTFDNDEINTGYYLYPRSSISNTPLRLANSVGIIDSGYRGHLIGKFDCIMQNQNQYRIQQFDRLLQICAPGLVPIYVELVLNKDALGVTERESNGFGSSGR